MDGQVTDVAADGATKFFQPICRNPVSPFVVRVKAGKQRSPENISGDDMPHYLVSGYLPTDFDPSVMTEAKVEEIHALNREMIAAGVRRFAGGLGSAHTLRTQPNGDVLVTDGPYLETKELVGGISILETADLDEALMWARKGAKAGGSTVEVREIFFVPAPALD
jgi:hypothetical protein